CAYRTTPKPVLLPVSQKFNSCFSFPSEVSPFNLLFTCSPIPQEAGCARGLIAQVTQLFRPSV
uniref:Uncharacterized protein n=1 Tax=Otolemur garnettii TaxID=30611 RepID=H0XXS8_OTOGA